jgi:hypothetical protein
MGGREWKLGDDWLSLDASICNWSGLDCTSDGKIRHIILCNKGLTGKPTKEIFSLSELKVLNFESNLIEFDFDGISSAKNLEALDLIATNLPPFR